MRSIGLLLTLAAAISASSIYTVTDVGGLGGTSALGYGINSAGTVVGFAQNPFGYQQAIVSQPGGGPGTLSLPGATESGAYGINASGTVVGNAYINGQAHGVIWSASGAADLGAGVYATGINDAGQVIGSNGHAYILTNGVYRDLGVAPGGDWSSAYGINATGAVVGYGSTGTGAFRGLIWSPAGSMVLLGTFGGSSSQAMGINDNGEVVGFASLASGYQHAFSAIDAMMIDLGTLGGGSSFAYGINDSGTIVGYSWLAGGPDPHAFVYLNGAMQDLNSLIPAGSGWQLLEAYGINASGQITGAGLFNGMPSVFLLNPLDPPLALNDPPAATPEPGTLAFLGAGMVLLLAWRWRRTAEAD